MAQHHRSFDVPISPLLISDRLISLAEQAGTVGCTATARHLLRLASAVLEEKTGFAPLPAVALSPDAPVYRAG